jgi:hypothetical protein
MILVHRPYSSCYIEWLQPLVGELMVRGYVVVSTISACMYLAGLQLKHCMSIADDFEV